MHPVTVPPKATAAVLLCRRPAGIPLYFLQREADFHRIYLPAKSGGKIFPQGQTASEIFIEVIDHRVFLFCGFGILRFCKKCVGICFFLANNLYTVYTKNSFS